MPSHASASGGRAAPESLQALGAFLDLDQLVGHQPVRLAVHPLGRLLVRGFDQAEDLARAFVEPVLVIRDTVLALDL